LDTNLPYDYDARSQKTTKNRHMFVMKEKFPCGKSYKVLGKVVRVGILKIMEMHINISPGSQILSMKHGFQIQ
jgi:hypothetical protein